VLKVGISPRVLSRLPFGEPVRLGRVSESKPVMGDTFVRQNLPAKPGGTSLPVAANINPFASSPPDASEKIVGMATIYGTGSHKPVKALVKVKSHPSYFANNNENKESFNLYVKGKLTGYTTVISENQDLHINYMESTDRKHYEGVGTALHQIAVESSIQRGHHGRVTLDSLDSAVGFHFKSGFRTDSDKTDDKIRRTLDKAKRQGIREPEINVSNTLLVMHLPGKKIREWTQRIASNPILTANNP
jgi:hypothetical protein